MHRFGHSNSIIHLLSLVISLVISVGFIIGVISGLRHIVDNQYLKYGMIRLVTVGLQRDVNHWILLSVACCLLMLFVLCVLLLVVRLVPSRLFDIHAEDDHAWFRGSITVALCSLFLVLGGWASSYLVPPDKLIDIRLLANFLTVLFPLCVVWLLLQLQWKWRSWFIGVVKRTAVVFLVVLLVLNLSVAIDGKVNVPSSPNVLLIIVDTLRADRLGCYGYEQDISPHIDMLAKEAVLFRNAISAAPWTTPSIGSILSSQYPAVLGFEDDRPVKIDGGFLTLAEVFRENNYKTKGIVSHTYVSSALGFDQGFDSYDEENAKGHGHVSSVSLVDKAIEYVEAHGSDTFLLFMHFFDPHYDFILHEPYDYYPDYDGCVRSGESIVTLRRAAPCMPEDDIDYVKALHDSEISFTDEHIGRLLDKLKELDIFDKTLIVFTADHGEEFCERGDSWIGHTKTLYQELVHVPLVIKPPFKREGRIVEDCTGLVDLMPTVIDYIGLKMPEGYTHEGHGLDLIGENVGKDKPIISETTRRSKLQSVVWRDWKLISDVQSGTIELYNLRDDPRESRDVALGDDPILKEMQSILLDWNGYVRHRRSDGKARQPEFTKEQMERLRSLGYVD